MPTELAQRGLDEDIPTGNPPIRKRMKKIKMLNYGNPEIQLFLSSLQLRIIDIGGSLVMVSPSQSDSAKHSTSPTPIHDFSSCSSSQSTILNLENISHISHTVRFSSPQLLRLLSVSTIVPSRLSLSLSHLKLWICADLWNRRDHEVWWLQIKPHPRVGRVQVVVLL